MLQLASVAETSRALAQLRARGAKVSRLADLLRTCTADEVGTVALWLTGETGRDRLGVGPAQVHAATTTPACPAPRLTVAETRGRLSDIAAITGSGSKARRAQAMAALFAAATVDEQSFLSRLLLGELRQGALAALVIDAIALRLRHPGGFASAVPGCCAATSPRSPSSRTAADAPASRPSG